MGRVLLLCFAVAIADVWLLFRIAGLIGFWPTLLAVFLSAVLGSLLARHVGLRVLGRLRDAMMEHRVPEEGALGGLLVLLGGMLLVVPGPLTTLAGLALFAPGVRRMIGGMIRAAIEQRVRDGTLRVGTISVGTADRAGTTSWTGNVIDTQGEVVASDDVPTRTRASRLLP